jgi:hypothetical protein
VSGRWISLGLGLVGPRRRAWRFALLVGSLGLGCGATQKPADATLSVRCDDRAAQLYLDESYAGLAAATRTRPLGIAAGTHRLELRAEGKLSSYRELSVRRGEHATVEVELHPDLDQADGR